MKFINLFLSLPSFSIRSVFLTKVLTQNEWDKGSTLEYWKIVWEGIRYQGEWLGFLMFSGGIDKQHRAVMG